MSVHVSQNPTKQGIDDNGTKPWTALEHLIWTEALDKADSDPKSVSWKVVFFL